MLKLVEETKQIRTERRAPSTLPLQLWEDLCAWSQPKGKVGRLERSLGNRHLTHNSGIHSILPSREEGGEHS